MTGGKTALFWTLDPFPLQRTHQIFSTLRMLMGVKAEGVKLRK